MSEMQTIMGLVFITVGALFCFAGWPLYRVTVAISGFLTGGAMGAFAGEYLMSQSSSYGSSADVTILLIALITAVVGAWLAVKLINVVAFLFGFAYFAAGAGLVLVMQRVDQDTILALAVVLGIVGGILAVLALRFSVTLSTAITGAILITMGAQTFDLIRSDEVALVTILALTVLGFIVQYGFRTSHEPARVPAGQTSAGSPGSSSSTPTPPSLIPGARASAPGAATGAGSAPAGATLPIDTSLSPGDSTASSERFCPECGAQLDNTATRFCNQCGEPLT